MSENDFQLQGHKKYIPERNYPGRGYESFGTGFSDMCQHCDLYYAIVNQTGLTKKPFPPRCRRHVLEEFKEIKPEDLSSAEEYDELIINADPVAWSYKNFGWTARWYQEEVMSCTAQKKVVRAGRRCLKEGTLVATPKGPVPIENIRPDDLVYDEFGKEIRVISVFEQGEQEVVDLLIHGTVVATATPDHRWLTYYKNRDKQVNRQTDELTKRHRIVRTEVRAPLGLISEPMAYVIGALAGDGSCRESGVVISTEDLAIVYHIANILGAPVKKSSAYNFSWRFASKYKDVIPFYRQWLDRKYAHEKVLDLDVIKSWDRQTLLGFVAGLIDTDGSVFQTKDGLVIAISMQAKPYIEALQYAFLALWQIDIPIRIDNREKYKNGPLYCLCLKHIYHSKRALKELSSYLQVTRKQYQPAYDFLKPNNFNPKGVGVKLGNRYKAKTYDLEVASGSSLYLLANGMVTHNTGKTAAIVMLILWGIYTHNNWNVLVIAPYQSQVTKIFDEIEKMLALSPVLAASVKRQTKNPQRLDLVNGSKVLGFSSGAKSATKSDKIRGQDANLIVLDEADYLGDPDLEAILAILASHPDCALWASSTPSGRHAKFYQWCTDKNLGFKEFHYISAESPSWTEEAEDFFKTNFEAVSFEHEFYAEFGLQLAGVFRNDLIDRAIVDYPLPQPRSSPYSRVVMGVDWNGEKNGVHIVITEYWNGKYKVLNKTVIRNDQFTQHASVDAIVRLDHEYKCNYIYVDEGYGKVQVEMLHKMGLQNPASGLLRRVVAYAFNKPVEIRDPKTGAATRKPSKPFLVNMTALQLEEDRMILPLCEDTQHLVNSKEGESTGKHTGIVQQMRNFAIERMSVLGLPTYTQGDDHSMFAFMLSIIGFVLEYTDLRRSNMSMALMTTRMSTGGILQEEDHQKSVRTPAVRQLDAGMGASATSRDLISIFKAKKAAESLRRAVSKGNKNAIQKHFASKNINRSAKMDRPGRGSF